ncbi:uncharacterized protein LOC123367189 isoform X2 [Mauremys mutica]|uniref:uncharacterized protein LOC123367189 isoform X2 n=1 Tax=Mauremys mutica TaxID=74926 RepID=UPI001D169161|nr:uncharacterized protein LOC123367189 isoform X2 [Mauremys mutica]
MGDRAERSPQLLQLPETRTTWRSERESGEAQWQAWVWISGCHALQIAGLPHDVSPTTSLGSRAPARPGAALVVGCCLGHLPQPHHYSNAEAGPCWAGGSIGSWWTSILTSECFLLQVTPPQPGTRGATGVPSPHPPTNAPGGDPTPSAPWPPPAPTHGRGPCVPCSISPPPALLIQFGQAAARCGPARFGEQEQIDSRGWLWAGRPESCLAPDSGRGGLWFRRSPVLGGGGEVQVERDRFIEGSGPVWAGRGESLVQFGGFGLQRDAGLVQFSLGRVVGLVRFGGLARSFGGTAGPDPSLCASLPGGKEGLARLV